MARLYLREILDSKGLTPYWLADKTGIHYNNMSKIVNNKTKSIRFDNVELICYWLECTPNDLFNYPTVKKISEEDRRLIQGK